jgi:hypothetical protein
MGKRDSSKVVHVVLLMTFFFFLPTI